MCLFLVGEEWKGVAKRKLAGWYSNSLSIQVFTLQRKQNAPCVVFCFLYIIHSLQSLEKGNRRLEWANEKFSFAT